MGSSYFWKTLILAATKFMRMNTSNPLPSKKNLEILRRHLDRQHFQELRYLPKKASIQGRSSFKNFLLKIWAIFTKIVIKSASACLIGAAAQISKFTKFWWVEPILVNFGDFDIDFKILKKSCNVCDPILWPILENFDLEFWLNRKVTITTVRNFDFVSNFEFCKNRKFEILNPSSNSNFGSLTLIPNFGFWQILGICTNLPNPNLIVSFAKFE